MDSQIGDVNIDHSHSLGLVNLTFNTLVFLRILGVRWYFEDDVLLDSRDIGMDVTFWHLRIQSLKDLWLVWLFYTLIDSLVSRYGPVPTIHTVCFSTDFVKGLWFTHCWILIEFSYTGFYRILNWDAERLFSVNWIINSFFMCQYLRAVLWTHLFTW